MNEYLLLAEEEGWLHFEEDGSIRIHKLNGGNHAIALELDYSARLSVFVKKLRQAFVLNHIKKTDDLYNSALHARVGKNKKKFATKLRQCGMGTGVDPVRNLSMRNFANLLNVGLATAHEVVTSLLKERIVSVKEDIARVKSLCIEQVRNLPHKDLCDLSGEKGWFFVVRGKVYVNRGNIYTPSEGVVAL